MVLLIITILAGMALAALNGATELAREQRTRSIIAKLDLLIQEKYEEYRTRPIPIRVPSNIGPLPTVTGPTTLQMASRIRLYALRDLMRLEMPDRISDLCNAAEYQDLTSDQVLNAVVIPFDSVRTTYRFLDSAYVTQPYANQRLLGSVPSVAFSYKRKIANAISSKGGPNTGGWTREHESAECLHLILSTMRDGDKSALDFFTSSEIGDTDEDGMNEILDAWGTPILFIRWPAGYVEHPGPDGIFGNLDDVRPLTTQTRDYTKAPDSFDPFKADPRWSVTGLASYPYGILPLIVSAGRDRSYDINFGTFAYIETSSLTPAGIPNDPYHSPTPGGLPIEGQVFDADSDGSYQGYADNITNHFQQTP